MQKKRFKINVLDVAIIVAVLCSLAILFFRETINEFITKPEIVTYQVNISVDGAGNVANVVPASGKVVTFDSELEDGEKIEMTITSAIAEENPVAASNHAEVVVVFKGYKRFGKYYTESGERIYNHSECRFYYDGKTIEGSVCSIVETDN